MAIADFAAALGYRLFPARQMSMASLPDLSIIIVSHNHAPYLTGCLNSLRPEHHRIRLEIWVVDNCSTDGAAQLVRDNFPFVNLLENKTRLGFSANNNRALRQCSGRYALLLNPDTETPPGALEKWLAFMDANPQVGLCGPQLRFPNGTVQPSCRRFPTLGSVLVRRTPFRRWLWNSAINERHLMEDFHHDQTRAVDWMLGAALMAPRRFLQTVGLLDEGYFLYVEDIDWAYRARQSGWEVVYFADAQIVHHHLAESDRKLWSRMSWYHLQSMWRYYWKHLAPRSLRLAVEPERLP